MRPLLALLAAILLATSAVACAPTASAAHTPPPVTSFDGGVAGDDVKVRADQKPSSADYDVPVATSSKPLGPVLVRYERLPPEFCHSRPDEGTGQPGACSDLADEVINVACPDGSLHLYPLFKSTREVKGDGKLTRWSTWEYKKSDTCVDPGDLADAARKALKTFKISPSPMHVPSFKGGLVMINIETVTYTDATPQEFAVTLLGIPVQVQAVPASFTWSFTSQGSPDGVVTTTDPGAPLPDFTLSHTFTRKGDATVSLATTWAGRFRIQGTAADPDDPASWTAIPGEARTDSGTTNLTVYERRSHLVEDLADQ